MTRNKKIAITGGIGSGKSTVAGILKEMGVPVFSCDRIYGELTDDVKFVDNLRRAFGDVQKEDGTLDREKLSRIVFSDGEKRARLEKLTHPAIFKRAFAKMNNFSLSFLEVPLLFEGGYADIFDGVIVVLRQKDKRIAAISSRDGLSEKDAVLRINSQFPYENSDFAKYYVIRNDYDFKFLEECVRTTFSLITKDF